eukprot:jgi/Ulvmu1/9216/UM005_0316.1
MEKWQHIEYDIIDVGAADAFKADYTQFMSVMHELERRLCQVVLAAFDDCATMSATFKLLDSFEGLLERDVIAQVWPFWMLAFGLARVCTPLPAKVISYYM